MLFEQKNNPHILAKQNFICRAPCRGTGMLTILLEVKNKKLEMECACQQNATDGHPTVGHALDCSWKKSDGTTG